MFEFHIKLGNGWYQTSNTSVVGAGYVRDGLLRGESLAAYFERVKDWAEFVEKVQKLNGFFAVVVCHGKEVYVAADRVRSIPLFYTVYDNKFILSDDPQWVQTYIGGANYDPVSLVEFLLTGYVTGSYTLDQRVRQIQAGEAIRVCKGEKGFIIQPESYYQFITGKKKGNNFSKSELLRKLDEVTLAAVERLIRIADGRPIVIPLSGGLDSRLIVMSLKRLGFKNILTFSYGVRNNWESKVSRDVAQQLGIPWYFVEYSRELWKQWYWSPEFQRYIKNASNLVSLAHVQDWPAVMELRKKRIIPKEAVVVPGHSNDFVAGSHIPLDLLNDAKCDIQKLLQVIWQHHYILMDYSLAAKYAGVDSQEAYEGVWRRLEAYFEHTTLLDISEAIGLYEMWDWRERQAKYIVNSVRVYEFFGLDWWLPWWDSEVMSFWEDVPLRHRVNQKLYREYVKNVQKELKIKIKMPLKKLVQKIVKRLDKVGFLNVYIKWRKLRYSAPILAFDGAFDQKLKLETSLLGAAALSQISNIYTMCAKSGTTRSAKS